MFSSSKAESVWSRDHPFEMIIGDPDVGVRTRTDTQNECLYLGFLSQDGTQEN